MFRMLNRNETYLKAFGERIRQLRENKKISLTRLAYDNDINKATLSMIENGKNDPQLSTIKRISLALDISVKELFDF